MLGNMVMTLAIVMGPASAPIAEVQQIIAISQIGQIEERQSRSQLESQRFDYRRSNFELRVPIPLFQAVARRTQLSAVSGQVLESPPKAGLCQDAKRNALAAYERSKKNKMRYPTEEDAKSSARKVYIRTVRPDERLLVIEMFWDVLLQCSEATDHSLAYERGLEMIYPP